MQLDPDLTLLIGTAAMLCADVEENKYLIKGLDNGTTAKDVAQILLNCAEWVVKPQNLTKSLDKRRPDYIVCASTPPPTNDFCLEGKWIKIVKWTPPRPSAPMLGTGERPSTTLPP